MAENTPKAPEVFSYLDALYFLKDYYAFRKALKAGFSYEAWADELGFKSRSYLRMVLFGKKKISQSFCEAFCLKHQLPQDEEDYFRALVSYSQASTHQERQAFGAALVQILKRNSQRPQLHNQIDFVSTPLYPRLLTLLGFDDLVPTAQTYARLLNQEESVVQKSLETLLQLGLAETVQVGDDLHWKTTLQKFSVPEDIGNTVLMRFHEQSLTEAIQAFHKPREERRYRSLLLPLSREELNEYYKLMDGFAADQLLRFQSNTYQGRKLFQVNLNIFPVAEES